MHDHAGLGDTTRDSTDRRRRRAIATAAILFCGVIVAAVNAYGGTRPRPDAEPYLGLPSTSPVTTPDHWITVPAFPALTFDDPLFMIPAPRGGRLYVAEREGRVVSFDDDPSATTKTLVLDISSQTQGNTDAGLMALALHPEFGAPDSSNRGFLYVAYAYSDDPVFEGRPGAGTPTRFRLSRFTVADGSEIADPGSEVVLIDQDDQNLWHMGGAMFFHPVDGFLYVTLGDEGGGRCMFGNCQRIDRDLFAGALRIDVDRQGGDISHPIVRQPLSGATANYYVPNDNPFVGTANALEEFYAIGLRNPHRMTHDPVDGLTWIGDVGQSQREEIDILARGANYQWHILEGSLPFGEETDPPDPLIGTWTDPLYDYGRGTIIGGYVYRGEEHFELYGKYVYGDFNNGRIWALSYDRDEDDVVMTDLEELYASPFRGRSDGITSFGLDANAELYVLTLGDAAQLQKLVVCDKEPGDIPLLLSRTGLFTDLATLAPNPALVPYSVNTPLWSDGAIKRRWFAVPSGETIDFSAQRAWDFPAGSVFVKHFELPVDDSDPSIIRRLETRVLVAQSDGGYYGVTYRWHEDQSDADLLVSSATDEIAIAADDGSIRTQLYRYPSPTDCLRCHTAEAGRVLGVKTSQLAGRPADPEIGAGDGLLSWLSDVGFFDRELDETVMASLDPLSALDDESVPLRDRVRSYLDSNCAHCHGSLDIDRSQWDARFAKPLSHQGIVRGTLLGEYDGDGNHVLSPGDLDRSILYRRVVTVDRELRMPPLGRNEQDAAFADVLRRWILELGEGTTSTTMPPDVCGDPWAPYGTLTASDALGVARTAIGGDVCLPCVCDVNDDGAITVTDALLVLRRAVRIDVGLGCAGCSQPHARAGMPAHAAGAM